MLNKRSTLVLVFILLVFTSLACSLTGSPPQGNAPAATSASSSSGENQSAQPIPTEPLITRTPVPIPDGWKVSTDASGKCQVAAPPDWKLGVDFYLEAEKSDPGPIENAPGEFPPSGLALWAGEGTPMPVGHLFQVRTSRVIGEQVCSVWRVKKDADFTAEEKSQMEQVGATLQKVP
jgi:hypothetical protein